MLKKEYSVLGIGYFEDNDALVDVPQDPKNGFLLLNRIIEEPDIAYYPRTLYLGNSDTFDDSRDYETQEGMRSITANHCAALRNLLDGCSFVNVTIPEDFDGWEALHFLVTALPNLESVFDDCTQGDASELLSQIIQDIAAANRDEKSTFHGKALTKLRHFSVLPTGSLTSESMHKFGSFGMLPSMRVFSGSGIDCNEEFNWPPGFHLTPCYVTDLDITHSAVKSSAIEELIFGIPALKRFRYHHSGTEVGDALYRPNVYLESLRSRTTATLESLDIWVHFPELLSEDEKEQQYLGSMKMFNVLEFLRLEIVAFERVEPDQASDDEALREGKFFQDQSSRRLEAIAAKGSGDGEDTDDKSSHSEASQDEEDGTTLESLMNRLVDVLPSSVKSLTLIQRSNDEDMRDLLRGLIDEKAEKLPNLTKITFESLRPVPEEIKSGLTGAGIAVEETEGLLDRRERRVLAGRIVYDD
ncbi:hypothetical protein G7Y79_00046g082670 [Physcia stellaris]|nr:hypothetical protein G7Y79_00046g082670 [Physcia stellaris]